MSKWSEFTDTELMVIRQGLAKGYADGKDIKGESPSAWNSTYSDVPMIAMWIVQDITEELADRGKPGALTVCIARGAFCGYHHKRDDPID